MCELSECLRAPVRPTNVWSLALAALLLSHPTAALHHFRHAPVHTVHRRDSDVPLRVRNECNEDIWPAILTQNGQGPSSHGFLLTPGNYTNLTVGQDWQGRVWARTNCTFDEDGNVPPSSQGKVTCSTGDCGHFLECEGAVSLNALCSPLSDSPRVTHLQRWPSLRSLAINTKHTTTYHSSMDTTSQSPSSSWPTKQATPT